MKVVPVGIDVAKGKLDAAVWLNGSGEELGMFDNTPAGFTSLAGALEVFRVREGADALHVVLEPTGGYELGLVAFGYDKDWQISLPNPKQVRDWANGVGYRAKTDRRDAVMLAHYAAERRPPPQDPLPANVAELESLLHRRDDLEHLLRQERNRHGTLAGRPNLSPVVITSLDNSISRLEADLVTIDQAIAEHLDRHPDLKGQARQLRSVPGIGLRTVLPILVLLHHWQALTAGRGSTKGITAYVGLDPRPFQSGKSIRRRAAISRMGNGAIRRLLYLAALGGIRGRNGLREFYQRLVGRGKPKMVALIAAARKVIVWAWVVFQSERNFDPSVHPVSAN